MKISASKFEQNISVERVLLRTGLLLALAILIGVAAAWPAAAQPLNEDFRDSSRHSAQKAFKRGKSLPWYDEQADRLIFEAPSDSSEPLGENTNETVIAEPNSRKPRNPGIGSIGTPAPIAGLGTMLLWVVGAVMLLLLIGVVAYLLWSVKVGPKRKNEDVSGPTKIDAARIEELPFQPPQRHGDWLAAAREAFARGDAKNAIIYLYSHTLLTLDQRGFIRLTRGKTNRQYLRGLKQHPEVATFVADCMVPFEEAFFGDHDVSQHRVGGCLDGWGKFDQLTGQRRRSGANDE